MKASYYYDEVVGVIGGVGPQATNYFSSLLVSLRSPKALKDQEHLPFLVFNNPQIPDRTEYLLTGKNSPLPELIHSAQVLKEAGATFLTIPCNTAHAFVEEIEKEVGLEVLNMIQLTAKKVVMRYGKDAKVGLLATDGTIQSGTYQQAFAKLSKEALVILPDKSHQQNVMKAIYDIKSNSATAKNTKLLMDAAKDLVKKEVSVIILGCTEIPLALKNENCSFNILDPMRVLAKKVIERTMASDARYDRVLTSKVSPITLYHLSLKN